MLVPALALTGCTSPDDGASATPSPTAQTAVTSCDELPGRIADAVQAYVDTFADVEAEAVTAQASSGLEDFRNATAELRARGDELGCDPDELAAALPDELARLRGGTPVQDAVLATLVADPLGRLDPSDPAPVDIEVTTTSDLVAALSLAGSGSTIRIAPGEYVIGEPLVALRPVTLVGAGADETVLRSIAPGAGLLIDADGDVAVSDLALRHEGTASASVVIVTAGGFDLQGLTVAGGVSAESGAGGFGLILRSSDNPLRAAGSLQRVTDVRLSDHDGGGIFVGSDATPSIADVVVEQSGGCGLCFVENAAGTVRSTQVLGVPVGVRIDDAAEPGLADVTVSDAEIGVALTGSGSPVIESSQVDRAVTGVEIAGSGAATLATATISDSRNIGLRLAGTSTATIRDVTVDGSTVVGIGVADQAAPRLLSSVVTTSGDVGVIWAGESAGSARGLVVGGSRLGLQLSDTAAPTVTEVRVTSADQAALLATGSSAGRVTRLECPAGRPVALVDSTSVEVRESPTCDIADAR
jgi:hypothetical protein